MDDFSNILEEIEYRNLRRRIFSGLPPWALNDVLNSLDRPLLDIIQK